jgi:GT2 family glycosyltransferase
VTSSVVIPTIGRPARLAAALSSLAACRPQPDEVVVVDQSLDGATARIADATGCRRVSCDGPGIGRAINAGLRAAAHPVVLVTNDDCTVAGDWVAVALAELAGRARTIATGSVLAAGDAAAVPSLRDDPRPVDYAGTAVDGALYGANMAAHRAELLEVGGFDERIMPSAEDNDLGYRWLRDGGSLRYQPAMRVWHHDWRTAAELRRLHRRYGVGQGMFYAKHLLAGDRAMLRFLLRDVRAYGVPAARALARGRRPPDWCEGMLLGVPVGLGRGLRTFRRART